jgi:hypothetical protein
MAYVPRDELVGCRVSLRGPARTVAGDVFDNDTKGTVVALKGRHGSHRARVVVQTDDGRRFECSRKRLNVLGPCVSNAPEGGQSK